MAEQKPELNASSEDNVWKVTPSTDSSFNMDTSFFEPVNVNILEAILFSEWDKEYRKKTFEGKVYVPTAVKHLKKLKRRLRNNQLEVKWNPSKINGVGRVTSNGYSPLILLPGELRQALSIDTTKDYDIENAHPNILLNRCRKAKIPEDEYKHLKEYCENREQKLEEICKSTFGLGKDEYKMTKEDRSNVKTLMIQVPIWNIDIVDFKYFYT